jgi:hypothetical protein
MDSGIIKSRRDTHIHITSRRDTHIHITSRRDTHTYITSRRDTYTHKHIEITSCNTHHAQLMQSDTLSHIRCHTMNVNGVQNHSLQ